ncbi:MAG TPA: DGQHR domain-containing protein [Fimbriimonas sp.]|nr:DGQHR domain-containing protein [Fimbriimonas sp.]
MAKSNTDSTLITALRVRQWLAGWNQVHFDPKLLQSKPPESFYLFSMQASHLKALTGVYRRSTKDGQPRALDPNVQRGHEEERSHKIRDFVEFGYPWCDMSPAKRESPDAKTLRKPGWLPTAIIVNILRPNTERNGVKIGKQDLVTVKESDSIAMLTLPAGFTGRKWKPETVFPIEVIDGQHRLWAFEDFEPDGDYELPVVAFNGLDRSWQAYIFWSVNITPKRINRSLAFDLYPLLRREDWLTKFTGHSIYRETRCQELVEALWSHPESPWHHRINMLGESKRQLETDAPMVSQAAWIRTLMASFVKEWPDEGTRIGGLFGAVRSDNELVLPWNRAMQGAFLIYAGQLVQQAIKQSSAKWANVLRKLEPKGLFDNGDPAFSGKNTLLTTDQGIRGLWQVVNDLCCAGADALKLKDWHAEAVYSKKDAQKLAATDEGAIKVALQSLKKHGVRKFLEDIAESLATYDWRTSSTPGLTEKERLAQAVFRGSSGYKEMRRQLLTHLKATATNNQLLTAIDDVVGHYKH